MHSRCEEYEGFTIVKIHYYLKVFEKFDIHMNASCVVYIAIFVNDKSGIPKCIHIVGCCDRYFEFTYKCFKLKSLKH